MLLQIFFRTIIGYVIGNIFYFFKLLFTHENPIWVSDFYGKYVFHAAKKKKGDLLIFPVIIIMIIFGLNALRQDSALVRLWGLIFGGIGFLVLYYGWLHYLDKLYIFKDRLEFRFLLYPYKIIPFTSVKMVLRDLASGKSAHVIYEDEVYGLAEIGNSSSFVGIPTEVFQNKELMIDKVKIHNNIYMDYEKAKETLPKNPLTKKAPKKWARLDNKERLNLVLVLAFNPVTVMIAVTVFFGIQNINIYLILLFDLSVRSTQYFGGKNAREYKVLDYRVS